METLFTESMIAGDRRDGVKHEFDSRTLRSYHRDARGREVRATDVQVYDLAFEQDASSPHDKKDENCDEDEATKSAVDPGVLHTCSL